MQLKEIYRLSAQKLKEAGIASSELDARILICHALNISREKFIIDQNRNISPLRSRKINGLIEKRTQNIPVAYLIGHKEFFGIDFLVNKSVLIPRPESEKLVELALDRIKNHELRIKDDKNKAMIHDSCFKVLDLGTGSGNIIISLAKNAEADFYASDISAKALNIAKRNAKLNKVDKKIKFIKSDLLSNKKLQQKFDLIIANLPYVPKSNKDISVKFEPVNAIFAEDNGAEVIKRFLKDTPNHLGDNGTILIELDPRNADDILDFAKRYFSQSKIRLEKDLAGFKRYLIIA